MSTLIIGLILYFLIIIVFSLIKSPKIESPTLNLFKSMFPSWKFFDESVDTPVLLYRLKKGEHFGEWTICFPHPPKKWFHLFVNPKGNFYLAYHSHIQQLLGELDSCLDKDISTFHQQVSYKMTENFVRYELQTNAGVPSGSPFEFKISSILLMNDNHFEVKEDILLSPTLELS